jgi:hypothetical protein
MQDGKLVATDETFERRGPYVVSSIGSIPEPLPSVPMKGELYEFVDWDVGRLAAYPTLFSAGNVVTGKGNIVASRKHAEAVSEWVIERFLGLGDGGHDGEEALADAAGAAARAKADEIAQGLTARPKLSPAELSALLARVEERQRAVGYDGDYDAWMRKVTPPDLE